MLQKKILILINIIFGTFLLYTYYRGISNNPGIGLKLWGGVPQIITPYIIYSMFISESDMSGLVFIKSRFPEWAKSFKK